MRALKRLSHRDWLTLRDIWIDHLPAVDIENVYPEPTLWDLPAIQYPQLKAAETVECPYVNGLREAILREAILLTRKFIYCGTLLPMLSAVGKNTWTAMAAYEASFYGAKAFCYLLGFASLGRDSKLYIDAFYETDRKVGKRKMKTYDTCRIHRLDERLTHRVLWAMIERLLDTTTFNEDMRPIQTQLKLTEWDNFIIFRNRVIYEGRFWPLHTDMTVCDLTKCAVNSRMTDAALFNAISPYPFANEYFTMARLLKAMLSGMFQTIADVAPAFNAEVEAFNVLG